MSGAAVVGQAGDWWNSLNGFNYASTGGSPTYYLDTTYTSPSGTLFNANGSPSSVVVSLFTPDDTFDANAPGWGSSSPFTTAGSPYACLMAAMLTASSGNGFVSLGGLTPGGYYNLYTYSAGNNAGRTSKFQVVAGNGNVTGTSTYDDATTALVNGVDYLEFDNVEADATGVVTINFGNGGVSESDFNGLQLAAVAGEPGGPVLVPEPCTIALLSVGLGLPFCFRRRN
jgi:hypothetical protein